MSECLVIFTRYPEPGKTKTRLIPVLGAEGAASLQRQMTEQTIAKTKALQCERQISIAVYFSDGSQPLMENWLGTSVVYRRQSDGDLGTRMAVAFQTELEAGAQSVVIIGTDCPDLTIEILTQAFEALKQHDLVVGPAADGGYYLIGLRRLLPELFVGVSWGTSQVRQQTVEIAQSLDLAIAFLPLLNDIDRPEDLVGRSF